MKKVLALVLAFAMVFSSISFVFAEAEVSDEAAALATIGMLEGDGSGVTAEYETKELTRLTAAIMILKLRGLYEEALEYDGVNNFADAEEVKWEEGRNILAYVKDNPIGFGGNEKGEFMPNDLFDEQMLYKVLLENLGYTQTTAEVVGDFAWEDTIEFAKSIGLEPAGAETLTVGELAKAVVAALKTNVKDGKPWIEVLVESEKVDREKAVAAELIADTPELAAALKEAKALGNTVVEVKFEEEVNEGAADASLYEIDGLEVKGAAFTGGKFVRLETSAQTAGKVYKLTVGEVTVKFTGVAKKSGGPEIDEVVSEDVEEVVITFKTNVDFETGTDVDNYYISGVEIVSAEVDGDEVTLTTEGLKDRTRYTLKVTNMKSIDGGIKKTQSQSFTTKIDKVPPKIKGDIEVQTNERIVLTFTEKVTQESAEDLENYVIKATKGDAELEILSIEWDEDDEDNVKIVTETMENRKEYKLTVENVSDKRKVPNVMERPASKNFKGIAEDIKGPKATNAVLLSPTSIVVTFEDESDIDEDSALDPYNYTLDGVDVLDVTLLSSKWQACKVLLTTEEMETAKSYKLTVNGVVDEFGNEMQEKKFTIKALLKEFASSMPIDAYAISKNKVVIVFNKELDKATAEDISNYKLNKDIGAPSKASLKEVNKEKRAVVLEVSDLIEGFARADEYYRVTIDGVEDLVGNVLYYKNFDIATNRAGGKDYAGDDIKAWDDKGPVVEYVDILNKYVVALTFDEKVDYKNTALKLLKTKEGENATEITLIGKDATDNGTVVEFSDYAENDGTVLESAARYQVVEVSDAVYGIMDTNGNEIDNVKLDAEEFDFEGSESDPDGVMLIDYEQKNGKTFVLTFERDVLFANGEDEVINAKIDGEGAVIPFNAEIDGDEVTLTISSGIIKEEAYQFVFSTELVDMHGIPVADDYEKDNKVYTEIIGEYEDEDEPYIEDVVAKNRWKVVVTFDEDIAGASYDSGYFKLMNYDLDEEIKFDGYSVSDNELTLVLKKALEFRYEYELTLQKNKSIYDIAGIKWTTEEESFYFQGTNLADLIKD